MKKIKKGIASLLIAVMGLSVCCIGASAKTIPAGQTVGTVLFYITNSAGERILVSQIPVGEMESDMAAGMIDDTNHNYSLLDRYVTTVHQEAEGFTVPEFVSYAKSKSSLESVRDLDLTFTGRDVIRFWEIDQSGFDDYDTYTYDDLYGVARYNFPLLYEYWNYRTQDYCDPADVMSRDEVMDHIFQNGEPEVFLLSVRAFSQRYMITDSKYGTGDCNMENFWLDSGFLDNERALRVMKPMTKDDLYSKSSTASDSRYWVANILLSMENAPDFTAIGAVAAPTAVMTEDADNYYIRFACETGGAAIYYNHNYISPSYTPTCAYTGGAVTIPKSWFPDGTVTMTCRAVKEGCTDAGVVTLKLASSGKEAAWDNPYSDVSAADWYYGAVEYVTQNGLFDAAGLNAFGPGEPMTRAMLAEALYRLAGSPTVTCGSPFADCGETSVVWAFENGVVNGTSDTTFSPDDSITREQIAAMFSRYAKKVAGADMSVSNDLASFTDKSNVSGWAVGSMTWAVGARLINGTSSDTLSPKGTATRAQAAAMIQRLTSFMA